jgi:VWFA-related protein
MLSYRVLALIAVLTLTLGAVNRDVDRNRAVTFDVSVTDRHGNPIPALLKQNFKLYQDGVEQSLLRVAASEKPLALVVLMEMSDALAYEMPGAMNPAVGLFRSLRSNDWGAVVTFGNEPDIVSDFTSDKNTLIASLRRRRETFSNDVALYDAVYFVLSRMQGIDEKTAVLLIATGQDTTSRRRSYAQALRKAETSGAMIYTVALIPPYRVDTPESYPDYGFQTRTHEDLFTLNSFAEASGGKSFAPEFPAQFSRIHEVIGTDLRGQYTLTFVPSTPDAGTRLRKLKVEVVGTDLDHNGKPDKLIVRHKRGY